MSWVAAAVVGGAVIGGGASYLSQKSANDSASDISATTLGEQRKMYEQQKADFAPYKEVGEAALPTYYSMLGIDTPELTGQEKSLLEKFYAAGGDSAPNRNDPSFTDVVFAGYSNRDKAEALLNSAMRKTQMAEQASKIGASGARELSPLAQWQQQEFLKSQNRQDAARGLSGSGGASARIAEGNSAIAGQDYQNQYQRILDALKIGNNAAGSAGNAALQYSSQIGQEGNTQIGLALEQGQNQANLWQGLSSLPMDYLSLQNRTSPLTTTSSTYSGSTNIAPAATSTRYGDISLI